MGDVFAEESSKFGEILGPGKGENRAVFSRRMPLAWGIFGGIEGENGAPCAEEIPPERAKTGALPGWEKGEKWVPKKTCSELLQALFGCHYL